MTDSHPKQQSDLAVMEPDRYPPKFDVEIVKALHWCRLGRVRPDDESAFHRAKAMGLLAQDAIWRTTPYGDGVLIALGLLDGEPSTLDAWRAERDRGTLHEAMSLLVAARGEAMTRELHDRICEFLERTFDI